MKTVYMILISIFLSACGMRFKSEHTEPTVQDPVVQGQESDTQNTEEKTQTSDGNEATQTPADPETNPAIVIENPPEVDIATLNLNYKVVSTEPNQYFLVISEFDEEIKKVDVNYQDTGARDSFELGTTNRIQLKVDTPIEASFFVEGGGILKTVHINIPSDFVIENVTDLMNLSVLPKSSLNRVYIKGPQVMNLLGASLSIDAQEIIFADAYIKSDDPTNISDGSTRNIKIKADLISGRLKVLLAGRSGPSSTAVAPPGLLPLTHRNIAEARSRNCCYLKFNGGSIMCPSIVGTRGAPGAPGASSGSLEIVSGSESKHFTLTVETAPGIGGSGGPGGPPLHSQYFPGSSLSSTLGLYILDYDNIEKYMTQCPFLPYYNENKALYNSNPGTVGPNGFKGPDNSKYEYCTSFKDQERTCVRN